VEAYRTIWEWAGRVNNAWGRIKVLAAGLGVLTAVLLGVWAIALQSLGVAGLLVLSFAVLIFVASVVLLLEGARHLGPSPNTDRLQPTTSEPRPVEPPRIVQDVAKALQASDEAQRRSTAQQISHGPHGAREVVMEDRVELSIAAGTATFPLPTICEVTTPSGTTYRVQAVHSIAEPSLGAVAHVIGPRKAVAIFPDSFPNAPEALDPGRYEVRWEISPGYDRLIPTEVRREFTIH
jgi:hypothetical protein